jgi:cytochrome c556
MAYDTVEEKQMRKAEKKEGEKPFDVFEYQAAGYLSMPMGHEDQPYRKSPSSSRKSSSSSSSSLWQKTKDFTQRRCSREDSEEKAEKKQQREQEYKDLDLEKKTKFGMTEAGMRIVG